MKQLAMVLATASLAFASPVLASNNEENSAFSVDASSPKMSYLYDGVEYDYTLDEVTLTGDVAGGFNTLETYAARAEAAKQAERAYRDMQDKFGVDEIAPNKYEWDDDGAEGDMRVVVSIKRQLAFFYKADTLVGAASVTTARDGKLTNDETKGGTFTVSNVGTFGSVMGTPIINQPEAAILATGIIKKRAEVMERPEGDTIEIRQMMYLSLSFDHRIVDGYLAGSFLRRIADYMEQFDLERKI